LSARLLILDEANRVLLFRFVYKRGPLAGQDFWGTPGGGVEDGETLEQAAVRELVEETGLRRESVGSEVARREVALQLPDGEHVVQDERYFVVRSLTTPCRGTIGPTSNARSWSSIAGGRSGNCRGLKRSCGPRICARWSKQRCVSA
jgi:8-oxo-dGTP pyrophosphatase MutT (NUDIX family)